VQLLSNDLAAGLFDGSMAAARELCEQG